MRIGLLGDVHANLPALEAVLEHANRHQVTTFWCIGDLLGYGAYPDEVVKRLRQEKVLGIIGNYDLQVLRVPEKHGQWGARKTPHKWLAFRWAYEHLSPEGLDYLRSLPKELRLEVQDRRFLLTHGSPVSNEEHLAPDTPRERWQELAKPADVVICGHSHVPFVRTMRRVRFINPGSVGRPDDGDPRASYAILSLGTKRLQVHHYRVPYDVERAAAAIREYGLPEEFAQMVLQGRNLDAVVALTPGSSGSGPSDGQATAAQPAREGDNGRTDSREDPGNETTLQSVLKLARQCEYEAQHTSHVTRLALHLFDQLRAIHGLGTTERSWLEYAALLHDIGLIEGAEGHHKASLRIILDTPLLRLDKTERLIVGSVARYHRGALPKEKHPHFAKLKPASRRVVRILAGILRVADGLDYTHQSLVEDLVCDISSKQVHVHCLIRDSALTQGALLAQTERERALEKGQLLEEVLGRKLVIDCGSKAVPS